MANNGAVRKKRNGAAKGGAFSNDSRACIVEALNRADGGQREIRISNVPSGISSVS
jgi:hypothetical protein